jgi:phosphonate transport system substrate-binding protein
MMPAMSAADAQITFAIISSAPAASALLETVCDELGKRTKFPIKAVVLRTYDKLVSAMKAGEVDVAWAPPLLAIDLERAEIGKIRLCSRRKGKPDYSSAIFVKKTSPIETIAHLVGKRVAWVAKESSAGYVVPRLKLMSELIDPDQAFVEQVFRRTHEAVARAVSSGDSDVGATYVHLDDAGQPMTAGWLEAGLSNDDVRVIATAGPIPADVIAVSNQLAPEKADAITAALRDLGEPVLRLLNADAFDIPEEAHFDRLRTLVQTATPSKPAAQS